MSDNHLCKAKRIDEAIEEFQQNIELPFGCTISDEASQMAIQALDEMQKYQSLGTVEECRTAREKQIPKKLGIGNDNGRERKCCGNCGCFIIPASKYCSKCGQKNRSE